MGIIKKSFYKGYLRNKRERKKDEIIEKKYKEENKNVIVIRQKWWVTIFYILSQYIRFLLYIAVMFLLSLGVTILINAELRNMLFSNIIKNF
ncbi:MAG: hypothetical protein HFJ34_06145 [Clostridia bacterium]|nr:hypothetical protein [Clostridia bacterium]